MANVTNTVAILPGYLGGSLAYRKELSIQRGNIITVLPPTVIGSILGSALLLSTPQEAFDVLVPFLIAGACFLLAFQDRLAKAFGTSEHSPQAGRRGVLLQIGVLIAATYGAYFGAGLGIIVLAVLGYSCRTTFSAPTLSRASSRSSSTCLPPSTSSSSPR